MKHRTLLLATLLIHPCALTATAQVVACIGDSITYGAGITDRQNYSYPAQLQKLLLEFGPGWKVQNYGVSGATLLSQGDLPYIRQALYSVALSSNPDIVVIKLGTNDSKPQNWQYKDSFISDYCALIDSFRNLPSKPRVWICKPVPAFQVLAGITPQIIHDEILPMIDEVGRRMNAPVIDLYTPLLGYASLFPDGIHPNAQGAGIIAQVVAVYLMGVRWLPDFHRDGIVNLVDFACLAQQWRSHEPSLDVAPPPAGDGIVSFADLAGLGRYWLTSPWLLADWPLDETGGSVAIDKIGHVSGTLHGSPLWRPQGGRFGGALELDGVDDYMSTPCVLNPAAGPFTVMVWIKGVRPGGVILSQMDYAGVHEIWLGTDAATGTLMTNINDNGRSIRTLASGVSVTDGLWHRVYLVWDGAYRSLYVDGHEPDRDTRALGTLKSATADLCFGVRSDLNPATFWLGMIDDIHFYSHAVRP
jgi:acyl-CoA thioesterase-1